MRKMLRTATIVLVCVSALVAIHLLPEDWLAAAAGAREDRRGPFLFTFSHQYVFSIQADRKKEASSSHSPILVR